MVADDVLLYRWKDRVKSPDGPRDPVLRLLCLVLAGWWRDPHAPEGSPAVPVLAEQTGIGERALRDRLRQLDGIWIEVERRPGRRSTYRPILPPAGARVPTREELREGSSSGSSYPQPLRAGSGVSDLWTPAPWLRGPLRAGSGVPCALAQGSSVPISDRRDTQGARAGEGAPEGPAGAPPWEEDDQLPIPSLILRAVRTGNREQFDEMTEKARQELREEREAHG